MSRTTPHHLSETLLSTLQCLTEGHESYGLLDFPAHYNVGDSAIWCGAIAMLKGLHGHLPDYVSHWRYPVSEVGRFIGRDGIIYLNGGGNFGDIWPKFQDYRESVLMKYPRHRVIQLPQSLHYRDPKNAESARRAISKHRDFHLMVRDRESEAFSKENFDCPVILATDSAFAIGMENFRRNRSPSGLKALFRADQERRADAQAGRTLFQHDEIFDWPRVSASRRRLQKLEMGLLGLASFDGAMPMRVRRFNAMAHERVAMGFERLDAGDIIVTDRLHGHIMATLLDKPHVVIDNFYGKIRRFISAWGADEKTLIADDFPAARRMVDQILAERADIKHS